ncbi:alpha/beta fold hydrolase [Ferrovibrio sp.]|uniref:alpha/beta fold hydrolase n=1 Tax=Ferrovibrio sp. TaxID=1917215 RepID=UPI00261A65DE|nr:alpha/beta fold hydrolase [Ferrovibrio sp.]
MPDNHPRQVHRLGPRPLPLHLATANLILLSSLAAWPSARRASPFWNPLLQPRLDALLPALANVDPSDFTDALMRAGIARLTAMTGAMLRYRSHPWQRDLADPPAVWAEGGSRLLAYAEAGIPVLLVPSLVNRAYVLDLAEGQSLARWLPKLGLRPFLLDWGDPGETEQRFDLADYIARIVRALRHVRQACGRPPLLLGYCMGGNLALAAALQSPDDVAGLALLATPWDFHAGGAHHAALVQALAPAIVPPPASDPDALPPMLDVDVLQGFFWALDPLTALKKFTLFGAMPEGGENERRFIAMEDWLNDGVPLAGRVARECLLGWYGENTPPRGEWRIAGKAVLPQDWNKPALVVLPERDKLVPKEGAAVLLAQLPQADRHDAPSGHIGMVVGPRAEVGLWQPLAAWLTATAQRTQDTEQSRLPQRRRRAPGKAGGKPATKVRA